MAMQTMPENSNAWAHLQPQTFPVPQVQVNPPRKNVGKKNVMEFTMSKHEKSEFSHEFP
jgi:hypothetical protein